MSKYLIAVNWKMNLNLQEAKEMAAFLRTLDLNFAKFDLYIYCSFLHIAPVYEMFVDTPIKVGAQNMHYEASGPFTGEVSGGMLKEIHAHSVLLAHSERRHYFNEEYAAVNRKIRIALREGLHILLCVGESAEEKENHVSELVIVDQLVSAFEGLPKECLNNVAIAYEPIWAIGTGKTVTPEDAGAMQKVIRRTLAKIFGKDRAEKARIIYGGSVNPENVYSFVKSKCLNGLLIGSAGIKKDSFAKLLKKCNFLKS